MQDFLPERLSGAITGAFPSPATSKFSPARLRSELGPTSPARTTAGSLAGALLLSFAACAPGAPRRADTLLLLAPGLLFLESGGAEGARTPDLDTASVALSQLSYSPNRMGNGNRLTFLLPSAAFPYHC